MTTIRQQNKQLKHKPLVEAIFELRWAIESPAPGHEVDRHYKLLLGRFYDKLSNDFPEHVQLPTAGVPDELVGHIVQHQFWRGPNEWPVVQIGPGVLTVNSTADYEWTEFYQRAVTAVQKLFAAHPKVGELKVTNLILRYIDAIEFDSAADNAFEFLKTRLKTEVALPKTLFVDSGVRDRPVLFNWEAAFRCDNPNGIASLRFASGQSGGKPALVLDTTVQSANDEIPGLPDEFEEWITSAHSVTHDWFFKLIEGELEKRFSGE